VNKALAESPAANAAAEAQRGASARAKAALAATAKSQAKAHRGKNGPATVVARPKPSQEYIPECGAVGPVGPSSVWTAPPPVGGNAGIWTLPEGEEPAQTVDASIFQDEAGSASIGAMTGAGDVQDATGAPGGDEIPPTNPGWSAETILRQNLTRAAMTRAAGAPPRPSGVIMKGPAGKGRQRLEVGRRGQPEVRGKASGSSEPMSISR
jgi:hypothetical protein